tara:strand:- start:540 stop:854 length:315 start_codon:yes stop_codon:yes gene_type:complete
MKNFSLFILIIFTLNSCGGFKDAGKVLRNEKIKTTDEFLVKKKEPLELPPDYNKLPKPGSLEEKNNKNEEDKIREILKANKKNKKNDSNENSSIEKIILNEIKR